MPGIYIHLPFCKVHCSYCDFPLTTRTSLARDYYSCLNTEIGSRPAPEADSLYFGGGTPSLTPPSMLSEIIRSFQLTREAEITLEANPDDVTDEIVAKWLKLGITRLSLGIQSLEAPALKAALRRHRPFDAIESLRAARRGGLGNINADLIIGLPFQTKNGFFIGLEELIAIRPEHFSIYFLEVHDETALHRQLNAGKTQVMPEADQLECYEQSVERLKNSGYLHYEVSNFALPGHESRHNLKYWTSAPYYGYGAGACSYYESSRIQNLISVTEYIDAIQNGRRAVFSAVNEDADTRMRNTLIFGLRRRDGVETGQFEQTFGVSPLTLFPDAAQLLTEGLLEIDGTRLRLTHRGMLLSNDILSQII